MRHNGNWLLCDDGVTRPVFWAEIRSSDGRWIRAPLLADTGADRTVLSCDAFVALGVAGTTPDEAIAGLGGITESVMFDGQIRIPRSDGIAVTFRGSFVAASTETSLNISLLGRDITNHLALVVDRPGDAVCLLSRGEVYQA